MTNFEIQVVNFTEFYLDEDGLTLMQVFSIEFFNGEQKVVPQSCTVYISRMQYETIVKELISRGEHNTSIKVQGNALQNETVKDGTTVAQPKAFVKSLTLKDKIGMFYSLSATYIYIYIYISVLPSCSFLNENVLIESMYSSAFCLPCLFETKF